MKALLLLLIATLGARAASTKVIFSNTAETELRDSNGALLTEGARQTSGDGAVLQLGYYDLATVTDLFLGNWIPMTGEGSRNGLVVSTIGDGYPGPGRFVINTFFSEGSPTHGNDLPRIGTPLAIRFYDGTSIAQSNFFNAVSSPAWEWKRPSGDSMMRGLNDPGIMWEGGPASAFRTTVPVPEPSALVLMLAAVAAVKSRRGFGLTIEAAHSEAGKSASLTTPLFDRPHV